MDLMHYRESARQYGVPSALYEIAYRAAHRAAGVTVWNAVVVTMETVDKGFLADPKRRTGRFFGAAELTEAAKNPEYDLTEGFIGRAFSRGDRCFAFAEDGVLTSYGWYSTRPTEAGPGLVLHFDPAYAYMYKGFTLPRFRGHRLHAIGMASALEAYTREGSKGLVSYVESSNFASLRSCDRMGYQTFGHVVFVKTKNGCVSRVTGRCKEYGFHVEPTARSTHTNHTHKHGADCGHKAVRHDGHTDYLHDGHLHHAQGDRIEEHTVMVGGSNPARCTPSHACGAHDKTHRHGIGCGHEGIPHGNHVDYLVGDHLHHAHGDHCDDHGPIAR